MTTTATVSYIIKRNKKKESFDPSRITAAIRKAFLSQGYAADQVPTEITNAVVNVINEKFNEQIPPDVETVQDIVEEELIRFQYADVARAYIIYREEHKKIREEKTLAEIKSKKLHFKTEDGEELVLTEGIIRDRTKTLAHGLDRVNVKELVESVGRGLYDGVPFKEINQLCLKEIESRTDEHYHYSSCASRLILDELYKNILGSHFGAKNVKTLYQIHFEEYLKTGIEQELLNPELENFDLKAISKAINHECDYKFFYLGMQTLYDRYLLKTRNKDASKKRIFELPQWMWMRVAMGLALSEPKEKREQYAIEFYQVLSNHYLISSTPTLFNSGTGHMQLSSCYINTVDDSLGGIFKNYSDNAQLSKWAGGIGTDWTRVRASGSMIRGTNGESSGIIPFIKIFNDIAIAVNQGGKRRGAMAAYLENWHLDIDEFIELKKNTGDERRRAHDIHPAVFISDLFMKRVEEDGEWTLFSPSDTPDLHTSYGKTFEEKYIEYEKNPPVVHRKVKAKELWRKTITMLYETGHPWITFKDAMNVRSPQDHVGMIHSSNLCTEITLNTSNDETAVCNLASVNLAEMVSDGKLNEELIKSTITTGMRMLDNVVDINFYPTPEARNSNMKHRPVGLGMMGYHDALFKMGIPFSSDEQVDFADRSMEMISYYAILASSKLAAEKGTYESYQNSKWERGILPFDTLTTLERERGRKIEVNRSTRMEWQEVRKHIAKHGMRNSNCMAIAPTATISNIAGVIPCVEPIYSNIYMKENLSGNFYVINRHLIDRLEKLGLWQKAVIQEIKAHSGSLENISVIPEKIRHEFKEVMVIDQRWILKAAACRSKWIDQSASTNLFLNTRKGNEIDEMYRMAWRTGLKTTYYLRTKASSQITKSFEVSGAVDLTGTDSDSALSKSTNPVKACAIADPDCESCQ